MNWMFVSPQNTHVEILTPKVIVFGGGPLGVNKIMRMDPLWMVLVPLKKGLQRALFLQCEDTQEVSSLQPGRGLSVEPNHAGH